MYEMSCKTVSGKIFEVRFMASTTVGITNVLYIEIIGKSMMEIVSVFSNPDETRLIKGYVLDEEKKQYIGYTNLIEANILADTGNVRIALTTAMDILGQ